ncbi:Nitroreductase [Daedaleopsis nitida]|nr:Nitroreductase [Daedaleopsis nitida]
MMRLLSIGSLYKAARLPLVHHHHRLPHLSTILSHYSNPTAPTPTQRRTVMSGSATFFEAVKNRRTYYAITPESTIPDEKVEEIIATAVKHAPSSFNSQSSRAVLLLGEEHKKLWEITLNILKEIVPAEQLPATEGRIGGFANGHGTILFFEDEEVVKGLQAKFPLYQDRFPTWAQHASGILQFIIWTALEKEGLGASLQHYNPLISPKVLSTWDLPTSWTLVAQMPFGKPSAAPGERTYQAVEGERFKVFGKQ